MLDNTNLAALTNELVYAQLNMPGHGFHTASPGYSILHLANQSAGKLPAGTVVQCQLPDQQYYRCLTTQTLDLSTPKIIKTQYSVVSPTQHKLILTVTPPPQQNDRSYIRAYLASECIWQWYYLLRTHIEAIFCIDSTGTRCTLPTTAIDFTAAEQQSLLPQKTLENPARESLRDFFNYPHKFHFFELDCTEIPETILKNLSIIEIQFNFATIAISHLDPIKCYSHCVPVVNCYRSTAQHILCDHKQYAYPITFEKTQVGLAEYCYHIQTVMAICHQTQSILTGVENTSVNTLEGCKFFSYRLQWGENNTLPTVKCTDQPRIAVTFDPQWILEHPHVSLRVTADVYQYDKNASQATPPHLLSCQVLDFDAEGHLCHPLQPIPAPAMSVCSDNHHAAQQCHFQALHCNKESLPALQALLAPFIAIQPQQKVLWNSLISFKTKPITVRLAHRPFAVMQGKALQYVILNKPEYFGQHYLLSKIIWQYIHHTTPLNVYCCLDAYVTEDLETCLWTHRP